MNYLSTACDILSAVEGTMDDEYFDAKTIAAERFGIPEWSFARIMDELRTREYIGGLETVFDPEKFSFVVTMYRPYLTLKGAEFLEKYSPAVVKIGGIENKRLSPEEMDKLVDCLTEDIK